MPYSPEWLIPPRLIEKAGTEEKENTTWQRSEWEQEEHALGVLLG